MLFGVLNSEGEFVGLAVLRVAVLRGFHHSHRVGYAEGQFCDDIIYEVVELLFGYIPSIAVQIYIRSVQPLTLYDTIRLLLRAYLLGERERPFIAVRMRSQVVLYFAYLNIGIVSVASIQVAGNGYNGLGHSYIYNR